VNALAASVPSCASVPVPPYEIVVPAAYVVPAVGDVIDATGAVFDVTVSVAALLVADPNAFVATHRNCAPLSPVAVDPIWYDVPVAPEMFELFRCHWYVMGVEPPAAHENVAGCPVVTVTLAGCCEIVGAWLAV
jgi:hypothetical protein